MQNVTGFVIDYCDSGVHCTQSPHADILVNGDNFAAAFELPVAYFELYDGLQLLLTVEIGDEEAIRDPKEKFGLFQLDAIEFLQPVAE